jgi:hypothetical protein
MTDIAKTAGLGRQSLYKALSPDGNPEFATVVLKALGPRLSVACEQVSRGRPGKADPALRGAAAEVRGTAVKSIRPRPPRGAASRPAQRA